MFISRKLAVGKRAQAEGDPPGHHPHWQGTTQRSPIFCRHPPGWGKRDLFSLREVAMDHDQKTIEKTWAPRSQRINKQNFSFFLQNHCWGVWDPIVGAGGQQPGLGPGSLLPPAQRAPGSSAHADGYRGASTRRHQHSLYQREWVLQANYALFHGQKESKEV